MATVGYAQVSSIGQNLNLQLGKLREYDCEEIFEEKESGQTAARPALKGLGSTIVLCATISFSNWSESPEMDRSSSVCDAIEQRRRSSFIHWWSVMARVLIYNIAWSWKFIRIMWERAFSPDMHPFITGTLIRT